MMQSVSSLSRSILRSASHSRSSLTTIRDFSDDAPARKSTKVKKKPKKAAQAEEGGRNKSLDLMIAALDAEKLQEPTISEEERARRMEIGKNYVKGRFQRHNEIDHDLSCKIKMKYHAMRMLPRGSKLQEEAMKIDYTAAPLWRNLPVWTPPIPGFDPSDFAEKDE